MARAKGARAQMALAFETVYGTPSGSGLTQMPFITSALAAEQPLLNRPQETELPQALKWQLARADADYDAVLVEAQRITVAASRIASESFALAVPPEDAERRCRRALMEVWAGRESAVFKLPLPASRSMPAM